MLIPSYITKNNIDAIIDLLFYKNLYVLVRKLHCYIGNEHSPFVCGKCLTSFRTNIESEEHEFVCNAMESNRYVKYPGKYLKWDKEYQKSQYI